MVRVEGGLFFANIDQVETTIMGMVEPGVRAVVLDAMSVPFIDVSATRMLVRDQPRAGELRGRPADGARRSVRCVMS